MSRTPMVALLECMQWMVNRHLGTVVVPNLRAKWLDLNDELQLRLAAAAGAFENTIYIQYIYVRTPDRCL